MKYVVQKGLIACDFADVIPSVDAISPVDVILSLDAILLPFSELFFVALW